MVPLRQAEPAPAQAGEAPNGGAACFTRVLLKDGVSTLPRTTAGNGGAGALEREEREFGPAEDPQRHEAEPDPLKCGHGKGG